MGEIRELAGRRIGGRGGVVRDADQPPVDGVSMKKYNTRPIDFTGCHPVIAEALKRGEEIRCWVWDQDSHNKPTHCSNEAWVVRYWAAADYPYRTATDSCFRHAEPITLKTSRIMPPERAIPVLIAEGFTFTSTGWLSAPKFIVTPHMYAFMGGDLDGEASEFTWPSCIIEEVEDDE